MKAQIKTFGRLSALLVLALSFAFCGGPTEKHQKSRYQKTKDRIEAYATKNPKLKADIKAKVQEFEKAYAAAKAKGKDEAPKAIGALVERMEAYEKAIGGAKPAKPKVAKTAKGKVTTKVKGAKVTTKVTGAKVTTKVTGAKVTTKVGTTCIDVETASAKQLQTLKGVGPVLASRIIATRAMRRAAATRAGKARFNFRNWATLLKVKGLSLKICNDNRATVCFSGRVQKTCPKVRVTATAPVKVVAPGIKRKVTVKVAPKVTTKVTTKVKTKVAPKIGVKTVKTKVTTRVGPKVGIKKVKKVKKVIKLAPKRPLRKKK